MITACGCNVLMVVKKPPKVRITSQGIGGKIFSIVIKIKIAL